jgi:hypothetical protein
MFTYPQYVYEHKGQRSLLVQTITGSLQWKNTTPTDFTHKPSFCEELMLVAVIENIFKACSFQ